MDLKHSESRSELRFGLRFRVLTFVGSLVVLSILGSSISLYRVHDMIRMLDGVNRLSIPLSRLFTQMQSDVVLFRREAERGLGRSHWPDPRWRPRPMQRWIEGVLENEIAKVGEFINDESFKESSSARWSQWSNSIVQVFSDLKADGAKLYEALERGDEAAASDLYPRWSSGLDEFSRLAQWAGVEYERVQRKTFAQAQSRMSELMTGLEIVLIVVVVLSLFFLWFGERALRPLGELTKLAGNIARRGLRKEDKAMVPEIPLVRKDEVSQLAREFHRMATALLEREKIVDAQKARLQEQNRLLREMGALNENVLDSIESILIVTDTEGNITQCNPVAARWLGADASQVIGSDLFSWSAMECFRQTWIEFNNDNNSARKVEQQLVSDRIYGGHIMPLRQEGNLPRGAIIVLDDLTDDVKMQERLRHAENLAAVGRMSAQVAHEVRNPLHSIGLEAEMASELAQGSGDMQLKQSLQSILCAVDRLENITGNYLKLSRLSSGQRIVLDLGDVIESVLATYATICQAEKICVDWKRETGSVLSIQADRDLLEQVFGNLFKNAIQALTVEHDSEQAASGGSKGSIFWSMGNTDSGKVWVRIEDNGPGVPEGIRSKLFTPFMTTRAQGTGLGLSFIKKVIEDHGGTIAYIDRSDRLDKSGACFEIMLPASAVLSAEYAHADVDDGEVIRNG